MTTIADMKRRYRMNLALGEVLPTADRGFPLPLSTGSPLFDAALTNKLQTTANLSEAEHLNRSWGLVRNATTAEIAVLADHAGGLLNDYKMLLALRCWQDGEGELTRRFLERLPWHWRLAFPTAVLKPAAHFFTGWRTKARFRLIDEPRYPELRALFSELLDAAPAVTLLKYRRTIKESAALQRYRFEGERQRIVHDLCFDSGRGLSVDTLPDDMAMIGTYLGARDALGSGGVSAMVAVLQERSAWIPLTSYLGLLGNADINLKDSRVDDIAVLRRYAVTSATATESLLRLAEWSSWLDDSHIAELSEKVRTQVIDRGLDVPFFKVTKAFMAVPHKLQQRLAKPLYLPLLRHFGTKAAAQLGEVGPITFVMPGNLVHITSFLLYSVLASAAETRFLLLTDEGVSEHPPLDLEDVVATLGASPPELQKWILANFGTEPAAQWSYTYDFDAIARTLRDDVDPAAPLVLDLPFAGNHAIIEALLPFEQVYNLSTTFGAPGEICMAYSYYQYFGFRTPMFEFGHWGRSSDSAAQRFTETLDRLDWFRQLADHAQVAMPA